MKMRGKLSTLDYSTNISDFGSKLGKIITPKLYRDESLTKASHNFSELQIKGQKTTKAQKTPKISYENFRSNSSVYSRVPSIHNMLNRKTLKNEKQISRDPSNDGMPTAIAIHVMDNDEEEEFLGKVLQKDPSKQSYVTIAIHDGTESTITNAHNTEDTPHPSTITPIMSQRNPKTTKAGKGKQVMFQ